MAKAKPKQFKYRVATFKGHPEAAGELVDEWMQEPKGEDFKIFKIVKDQGLYGDIVFNIFYREIKTEEQPPGELVKGNW